jgi:teichuronic acid biosynthesis glycosyltransferase TuaG
VISIVLATYDRAGTLSRAIDSVLRQTYPDWELVIVDDGSRDGTGELLGALSDPRIRVYHHPHNCGVDAAKNTGFDLMRGEWFTTFDSDDEMVPEALAVLLACAERTEATAVACNGRDARSGRLTGHGPTHDGWLSGAASARLRGDHWGITLTSLLGERRFDERLGSGRGLWLKVNARARRYYVHRALLIVHTEGADRVTTGLRAGGIRERVETYALLGEDREYLAVLAAADPREYRRVSQRARAAHLLRPFLGERKAGGPSP